MTQYVLRRAALLAVTLAIGSVLIYSALYFSPGDPVSLLLGGRPASPAVREALRQRYHLGDPFLVRYGHWLEDMLHGNLGVSAQYQMPVSSLLKSRAPVTLTMAAMAAVLVFALGIGLGRFAARHGGWLDVGVSTFLTLTLATPAFVISVALISVFGVSLGWFPLFGEGDGILGRLYHLFLPAVALAISLLALLAQTTRHAMREEMASEHVLGARARGLSRRHITRHHIFRNAAIPISTSAGLTIASLFAGSAVVETAFGVNGLGSLFVESVAQKDFPVVQVLTLWGFVLFGVTNLAVDVLYVLLDPRLRAKMR